MLLNLYAPSSLFVVFFPFLRIQMASLTHIFDQLIHYKPSMAASRRYKRTMLSGKGRQSEETASLAVKVAKIVSINYLQFSWFDKINFTQFIVKFVLKNKNIPSVRSQMTCSNQEASKSWSKVYHVYKRGRQRWRREDWELYTDIGAYCLKYKSVASWFWTPDKSVILFIVPLNSVNVYLFQFALP